MCGRMVRCDGVIRAESHCNGFMSTVERDLYHVNIYHQIGFKDRLIRLNDFVFLCVSYLNDLFGILCIEVSELMWIKLVHDVFAEHIGEFVFLHLTVAGRRHTSVGCSSSPRRSYRASPGASQS